jgi:hypothetical protein
MCYCFAYTYTSNWVFGILDGKKMNERCPVMTLIRCQFLYPLIVEKGDSKILFKKSNKNYMVQFCL